EETDLSKLPLEINIPADFKPVPRVKQQDVWYDQGWKHKKLKLEIRIGFFNMKPMLKEREELLKSKKGMMIDPNLPGFFEGSFTAALLNISQDDTPPQFRYFPEKGVSDEFNADIGATSFFKAKSDFSKGYKFVMVNRLQKKNIGWFYI